MEENPLSPDLAPPPELKKPPKGLLERLAGGYFRKKTDRFLEDSIKKYATSDDGTVDEELAREMRNKLVLRCEQSFQRDVREPFYWAMTSGTIMGGGALIAKKHFEGDIITRKNLMATVATVTVGACMDLFRIHRRFNAGLKGALSGAIRIEEEERKDVWQQKMAARAAEKPEESPSR